MASKKSPSIIGTLQKTTEAASAVNGEFVRQLRVSDLEDNPMNRFSMAEDEQFLSTVESVKKDGFLEDIIVTPAAAEGRYRIVSGHRRVAAARKLGKLSVHFFGTAHLDSVAIVHEAHDIVDSLLDGFRRYAVLFVIGHLNLAAATRFRNRFVHGIGDFVGIHNHMSMIVSRSAANSLNKAAVVAQKTLFISVKNSHERHFGQIEALAQQIDAHKHVELATA